MRTIFNDVEKDVLYETLCECSKDFAKKNGRDEQEEDVLLVYKFIEDIGRYDLVSVLVEKLREKGYKISERT